MPSREKRGASSLVATFGGLVSRHRVEPSAPDSNLECGRATLNGENLVQTLNLLYELMLRGSSCPGAVAAPVARPERLARVVDGEAIDVAQSASSSILAMRPRRLTWRPQFSWSSTVSATRGSRRINRSRIRLSSMLSSTRLFSRRTRSRPCAASRRAAATRRRPGSAAVGSRRHQLAPGRAASCGRNEGSTRLP